MIRTIILFSILCFYYSGTLFAQSSQKVTLSGYVKEGGSSELLPGVTLYIPELKVGAATNTYGFYSITVPKGDYTLMVSFIGYETIQRSLSLQEDQQLEIILTESTTELEEVVITADELEMESEKTPMSVMRLSPAEVRDMPALLGENDVMKTLQLMPGVQGGTEGSAGIHVRGGTPDQNLIILDDAIVYNANHLFGFFSVFNGDALKSVEMIKGGFPARFGGRLSSVVKMDMKDGNKQELTGNFKIGLISSSLLLEGPIKKDKTSFLFSGRRTYADVLSIPFQPEDTKGGYHFTDLNFKVNHTFNDTDKLYLSSYFGRDKFYARESYINSSYNTGLGWGNITSTLRWNHQFSQKMFSNLSLIFSNYRFAIKEEEKFDGDKYSLRYSSGIDDIGLKADFDYFPNPRHTIRFGAVTTRHSFSPKALVVKDSDATDTRDVQRYNSMETAAYIEDDWQVSSKVNILAGVRFSLFNYKSLTYFRPEPRITASWRVRDGLAVKASYAQMNQYIHLLTNSGMGLPTDLWVSSTDQVRPQQSDQVALGLVKDLQKDYTLSVEGYYKKMNNVISYKEGASFLVLEDFESSQNVTWEDNITSGEGWAYGAELLFRKNRGPFTGWIGYTLSWSQRQFEELNLGRKFNSKYDRRHDLAIVGMYRPNKRITLSGTWVFNTGINYTLPKQEVLSPDSGFPVFSGSGESEFREYITEVNNFRGENYHRFDVGIQFHKEKNKGRVRTWTVAVYNIYNRKNPFFYFIEEDYHYNTGRVDNGLKKVSIFTIVPSITYSLKF